MVVIRRCAASPAMPASANPALKTTALVTCRAAQASSISGTIGAGTAMMARSIGPGTDAMSG